MVEFMNWRKATSKNFLGVVHGNNWGDWLSVGEKTPLDYVDTVYFACSANLMRPDGGHHWQTREAARIRRVVQSDQSGVRAKDISSLTARSRWNTQTAYALALFMDLIPAELRAKERQGPGKPSCVPARTPTTPA